MYVLFSDYDRAMIEQEAPEQRCAALAGYRVQHCVVRLPAGVVPVEHLSLIDDEHPEEHWLLVSTRVSRSDSPVLGWIDWRTPQAPMPYVVGAATSAQAAYMQQILEVITHGFQEVVFRGRRPDMDEVVFRQVYQDAYKKLLDQARRDGYRLPTKTAVAAEMLMTRKTLTRAINRYHLAWPPVVPR